jgi:GNAT superfamily N-acetyltransferase
MSPRKVGATPKKGRGQALQDGPYRVRPVQLSDAVTLARQRAGLFREMGEVAEPRIVRHQRVFADWFRRELTHRRLWGFLAETPDGEPVAGGLLWLQPRPPSPRFPHRRIPYLLSVYTAPAHRRHGLAGRIVQELIAVSRRGGYPRVELHASSAGRSIYQRLGFRTTNQMRLEERPAASTRRPARRARKVPGLSSETC